MISFQELNIHNNSLYENILETYTADSISQIDHH